ncbi:MAG: hypothetical protein BMS9Abin07_1794 [Acidimicrobiia bacterium]|nr:MAG: hypothetical protein BMS9Abin07_1794 [Acidimicrobiia bacterium]
MRKTLTAVVAAGVLVAGAFVATAVAGTQVSAQEAPSQDTGVERPDRPRGGKILDEVLSDLVADGVIDQGQADAIAAALRAKGEQLREEREQWREENPGRFERGFKSGFRLRGLLEDGVIDADEIASLPDDHPLKDPNGPAAKYLDDDQLTADELRQLHEELRQQRDAERDQTELGTAAPTSFGI